MRLRWRCGAFLCCCAGWVAWKGCQTHANSVPLRLLIARAKNNSENEQDAFVRSEISAIEEEERAIAGMVVVDAKTSKRGLQTMADSAKRYWYILLSSGLLLLASKLLFPVSFEVWQNCVLKLLDVFLDMSACYTFFKSGFPGFGCMALFLIFFSSTVSFLLENWLLEERCSWQIVLHWTQLIHIQHAITTIRSNILPSTQFLVEFVEIALETSPQATLQSYASLLGVGNQAAVMGLDGRFVLQVSTLFSLCLLAKKLTGICAYPYGQELRSWGLWLRTFADISTRVLGWAVLGVAIKPLEYKMHAIVANPGLWFVLALAFLHCLQTLYLKADPPFNRGYLLIVSSLLCMVCRPLPIFGGLTPTIPVLTNMRVVEVCVMFAIAWWVRGDVSCVREAVFGEGLFAMVLFISLPVYVYNSIKTSPAVYAMLFRTLGGLWLILFLSHALAATLPAITGWLLAPIILVLVLIGIALCMNLFGVFSTQHGFWADVGQFLCKFCTIVYFSLTTPIFLIYFSAVTEGRFNVFTMLNAYFPLCFALCMMVYVQVDLLIRADRLGQALRVLQDFYWPSETIASLPSQIDVSLDEEAGLLVTDVQDESAHAEDVVMSVEVQAMHPLEHKPALPIFSAVQEGRVHFFDFLCRFTSMAEGRHPETGEAPLVWAKNRGVNVSKFRERALHIFGLSNSAGDDELHAPYIAAGAAFLLDGESVFIALEQGGNLDLILNCVQKFPQGAWRQWVAEPTMASNEAYLVRAAMFCLTPTIRSQQVRIALAVMESLLVARADANSRNSTGASLITVALGGLSCDAGRSVAQLLFRFGASFSTSDLITAVMKCDVLVVRTLLERRADAAACNIAGLSCLEMLRGVATQSTSLDASGVPSESVVVVMMALIRHGAPTDRALLSGARNLDAGYLCRLLDAGANVHQHGQSLLACVLEQEPTPFEQLTIPSRVTAPAIRHSDPPFFELAPGEYVVTVKGTEREETTTTTHNLFTLVDTRRYMCQFRFLTNWNRESHPFGDSVGPSQFVYTVPPGNCISGVETFEMKVVDYAYKIYVPALKEQSVSDPDKRLATLSALLRCRADPNVILPTGRPLLQVAMKHKNLSCFYELLKTNADPNIRDASVDHCPTALHQAISEQAAFASQFLLEFRADPNAQTPAGKGLAPLHVVAQRAEAKDEALVKLLLSHRANVGLQGTDSKTPLQMLASHGIVSKLSGMQKHRVRIKELLQ